MHVNQFTAKKLLVLVAVGVLLYVAHFAFIPIALALLFALVLSGPVEALFRLHVPRSLSATVILIIVLGLLAGLVVVMWAPTQHWFAAAPQTVKVIKRKLNPAIKFIGHVEELRSSAGNIGAANQPAAAAAPLPASADNESSSALFLYETREAMISVLTFVIVTLFLLAGGPPMLARMTAAFVDDLNAAHVLAIIEKVRGEVGKFYVTTALINVGFGLATAGVMMLCGMPTPFLWGVLAAALNFIPYAGSAATLIVLTLVAFVTFDGMGQVLAVAGSYILLAMVEGQIVQPLFVGRRLKINPLLIFLALWFGGLFWGIAGVVLATPALLTLKVIAEHAISGKSVMEFLGPNNQSPDVGSALKKLVRPIILTSRA
ncbi:MAG TPA: AI-2E family transporter [Steroidobacteraceae bacterium]|nr:AI-2E family transporter [Steroidobacteraceae bacterium]